MPSTPLAPVSYEPIRAVRTLGSAAAFPAAIRALEAASQTFKIGVPCRLVSGYMQECTFAGADIVYGVSSEPAHNLTAAGTAQDENEGSPQNQPSAVTTAIGAWPRDGAIGEYMANGLTVFSIALKQTAGVSQTFSQSLLVAGTLYSIAKDATSGFWYLDTGTTAGNSAVAQLVGVDPSCPNTASGGCRVFFQFAASKRYFA